MPGKISREDGSLSELFEILSHEYRRRILMAVEQANPRDEGEITPGSITDGEDDQALAVLQQKIYHSHLPKLNDAGFIDWNQDTGIITRDPRFEEIVPLLRLMHEHQDELPNDWP